MKAFREEETEKITLNQEIGKRLADCRKKRKWSQIKFAAELTVSQQSVGRYESGQSNIPLDILVFLHKNYRIDLNYLICGDVQPDNLSGDNKANDIIEDLKGILSKYDYSSSV